MKNIYLSHCLLLCLLIQTAFASGETPFPECPKVGAVKAVGANHVKQKNGTEWVFTNRHKKFGTNEFWTLHAVITADSEEDALDYMKQGLSHLKFSHIVPDYSCNYYARHDDGKFDVELRLEK